MREIKFRAWDIDNKIMLFTTVGEEPYSADINYIKITGTQVLYYDAPDMGYYGGGNWSEKNGDYQFMQYTGLKDKNGVEIYEGDIVNTDSDSNMIVTIGGYLECPITTVSGNGNGVHIHNKKESIVFGVSPFRQDNNLEVIGNIYQNPELIK